MTVNIGVIGTGMIGTLHARNLATGVAGSQVTAVTDVDSDRAAEVAAEVGATAFATAGEVIGSGDVDAVLIATPGFTHAEIVLDALAAGKPMLCEKPLATTAEDAVRIIEAEVAIGKRMIQVGFMRRFDPGYVEVKDTIDSGRIGTPLMAHMFHRNADVPEGFRDEQVMNDSFVHDVDAARFLFGEEIASVGHLYAKTTPNAPAGMHDPQVLIMETVSGALILAEAYVVNSFGYDVRCEVVGSAGTAELATPRLSRVTTVGAVSESIPPDWRVRFGETYRVELQAWVDSLLAGGPAIGPSSWDGYAATVVTATGVQAIGKRGERVAVEMIDKPDLYA